MAIKVLGLVDCFNSPEFGPMTKHRAVASTSFLGRYAFIDFPLSNFLNSHIPSIGILCQNHIRSLTRHVGNGASWVKNTKIGHFQVLYDEPNVANPGYNTDVADLFENKWFLRATKPDYVVIAPPYMVYRADFEQLIQDHITSGSRISLLYTHQKGLKNSFIGAKKIYISERGKVSRIEINRGEVDEGDISMGTMIMDYPMLENLMEYAQGTSSFFSLSDTLNYLSPSVLIKAVRHEGYVRSFDSLSNYLKYSLELINDDVYSSLFREDWPIYTKSYDSAPALYKKGGSAINSYVANGSIIEGKVTNCIVGRGVRVKKGAVVKNAVIGSDAVIECNTHIENAIVDKEAQVLHVSEVVGTMDNPIFIAQGDVI